MSVPLLYVPAEALRQEGPFEFAIEASEAGFPLGYMPVEISSDAGNGRRLRMSGTRSNRHGDLASVTYRQEGGPLCIIVFND